MRLAHGDIHWVTLPDSEGREQRGRRPAIIGQDSDRFPTPTVLLIPLTTRSAALRFPASYLVAPTGVNQLPSPSIAMVFQLRACDKDRVGQRLDRLDDPDLIAIQQIAKDLQLLP